ncbi:MAG TPA: response regulator [Polyangiaceae bacterium]|jgi:two-component system response regulator PilR (NtrC family)|nr:response regulator [Polyangiaceae bacterium]
MTSRVGARTRSSRPLNILVVEDDPTLAEALGRLFCRRGYRVRVTFTAAEADAAVQAEAFDCAILDIELGDEDGIHLASRLLTARRIHSAVFYSGQLDGETRRRATNLGPVVDKTARVEDIARAVERCVAEKPE